MDNKEESQQQLGQALSAADDWLRKQGVITDFSFNTILTWIYVNFEKVQNVELDVDRPKQRIFVRVYLTFWTLLIMTIFRKKDTLIDLIFNFLQEYLPTFEISVELVRFRGELRRDAVDPGPTPEGEQLDTGPIAEAKKAIADKKAQTPQT